MAEHSFVTVVMVELEKLVGSKQDAVLSGACANFPEYTKATGYINGVREAQMVLKELEKRLVEQDFE